MKRGLVISGGGSKGAFSGGVVDYLHSQEKIDWDVYIGSSTGALVSTIAATGDMEKLKNEYTTVTNESIYSVSPFNKKNKFKIFNAIWRILRGKKSLGEADKLRLKLRNAFTIEDFNKTIIEEKLVIISTTNATKGKTEYKYQTEELYDDFIDWVFSSANVPVLFDVFEKDGQQYLDGALIEPIPLQHAITEGCDVIDIILLTPIKTTDNKRMDNIVDVVITTINMMYDEIYKNDFDIGKLYGMQDDVTINIYRTPEQLTNNLYIFNEKEMLEWYNEGFAYAEKQLHKNYKITRNKHYHYDIK